jgi:hypothetical protein
MRVQHWIAAIAATLIVTACGASSSDDQEVRQPSDLDAGDAGATTLADTGAPVDAAPDVAPLRETCSDFTKGTDGWDGVGGAIGSSPDGFVFQLGETKRAITKALKSDVDIRVTHVRLDWSFTGQVDSLARNTTMQLLAQTYGKASLALKSDDGLVVAGNNGTSDVRGALQSGATDAQSVALVQGKSFRLATLWAPSGSATVENGAPPLSVEVPTLSPETRGRDFTLEIGGTISGSVGLTVTIRQVCVAFE